MGSNRMMKSVAVIACLYATGANCAAWDDAPLEMREWFQNLKDSNGRSCCGLGDALIADEYRAGPSESIIATVTNGKGLVRDGTEYAVPKEKILIRRANPTGHTILFANGMNVYCLILGDGI